MLNQIVLSGIGFLQLITPASVIEVVKNPIAIPAYATSTITYSQEYIKARISDYSALYGVSEALMNSIIKCESNFHPEAENISSKEDSVGLVQINLLAHPDTTRVEAEDPDYALDFLASNLKAGKGNMWTCLPK